MTSLLLLGNSISIFASEQKLYQAYSQSAETFQTSIYRVVDGKGADGKDNIVYCYNHEYNMPGIKEGHDNEKTYYTKIKSYLESNDPYTEKYGKEKKQRIAAVLVAGYPVDAYGLFKKFGITADQAIDMTQTLIWDINENTEGELSEYGSVTRNMAMYYNELWKFSKIEKFEQGKLNLQGKLEFVQRGSSWSTDKLSTIGDKGSFSFENLPKGIEVRDFNTDKALNGDIKVGQEFYITSNDKPNEDLKLKIKYKYQEVELHFYKHHSGGVSNNSKPFQNLVRAELTDRVKEIPLEIKINGNFEKPEIPEIGGTTPNLPGEEGSTPQLPGDSGLGGTTPNLPGEEGSTPQLPGDSGLGGTTPNLPGEEGSTPQLPGDSGLGGTTPNLPGEEGSTPQLPGDSGLGGTTPNLPGEEGITPQLPGDSGLGGTTPNLPGEEGITPQLPGDSGLGGTTPNLPGEEGITPQLPGDSGLSGTTPNLPGEEGITPQLPGDSGLGDTTPNLPGEEGSTPQLPGDSGLGGTTPNLPGEEGSTPQLPGDSGLSGTTPNLPGEEGITPQLPGDSGLGDTTPNLPDKDDSKPGIPNEENIKPEKPENSGLVGITPLNPKTGDVGILGSIGLVFASAVGLVIDKIKYKK